MQVVAHQHRCRGGDEVDIFRRNIGIEIDGPTRKNEVMKGETAAERFVLAWQGEPDERKAKAIDT